MDEVKLPELSYERIAMAGGEMPDGLDWPDRQVFLGLRSLYWQYKNGIVDRETAKKEKIKLLQGYDFQKWQDSFCTQFVEKIKRTEAARQEYRKNRTLENADALILAMENAPVTEVL